MADNVVEILVKSRNDTRAGFDAAKRDAEIAGEDAGQGFMARFAAKMAGFDPAGSGGGFGGSSMFSSMGAFASSPIGAGVLAAAIGAASVEVGALVTGLTAAAMGLGSFGILSAGTFSQLKQDVTTYQAAWDKLQAAQNLQAVDPSKQNAAAVARAQAQLQAAQLGMGQDAGPAAAGINALRVEYDKLSAAVSPLTFKVITDGVSVLNQLLPSMLPFAKAGGEALDKLMISLGKGINSAGFHTFMEDMLRITPGAITALGNGIGTLISRIGQMMERFTKGHDVINAFKVAFGALDGTLIIIEMSMTTVMWIADKMASNWRRMSGAFKEAWDNVKRWTDDALRWLDQLPARLLEIGSQAIQGFIHGLESVPILGTVAKIGDGLIGGLSHILGIHSPSTVLREIGMNAREGFRLGLAGTGNLNLGGSITGGAGYGHAAAVQPIIIQLSGAGGSQLEQALFNFIVKEARVKGGGGKNSVQIAFGQTH